MGYMMVPALVVFTYASVCAFKQVVARSFEFAKEGIIDKEEMLCAKQMSAQALLALLLPLKKSYGTQADYQRYVEFLRA